jgi:hypothetical protein
VARRLICEDFDKYPGTVAEQQRTGHKPLKIKPNRIDNERTIDVSCPDLGRKVPLSSHRSAESAAVIILRGMTLARSHSRTKLATVRELMAGQCLLVVIGGAHQPASGAAVPSTWMR